MLKLKKVFKENGTWLNPDPSLIYAMLDVFTEQVKNDMGM